MAIKKHEEIRLNVKPIFLTLYHEYVFEGPCRFGEGIQLEKEFDLHMAAEKFKGWYAQLQAAMPENVVNLLEPVKVERDENFLTKDEMIDKLAEGSEEVDLYFIGYASRPYDLALEFAQRVGKPCAITQACCASAITSAEFLARGLEFYSFEDWEDATEYMTVLRARKVMKDSKILAATRMTSTVSVSAPDSIIDPEKITERFGTRIRYVSAHELLDQISYDDMLELAGAGAGVLQMRAVEFARKWNVVIHSRSAFSDAEGTYIKEAPDMEEAVITGIAHDTSEVKVTIRGVPDMSGVAAKLFSALASNQVSVDMIIQNVSESGITDISFTCPGGDLPRARETVERIVPTINARTYIVDEDIAKVSLVGTGMKSSPGVAAKAFETLGQNDINILAISTSPIRLSVVVDAAQAAQAVQCLHTAFGLDSDSVFVETQLSAEEIAAKMNKGR